MIELGEQRFTSFLITLIDGIKENKYLFEANTKEPKRFHDFGEIRSRFSLTTLLVELPYLARYRCRPQRQLLCETRHHVLYSLIIPVGIITVDISNTGFFTVD